MKLSKKALAICATALVLSSLSAVSVFAASGNVLDQLEAVQDPETGKIVHVFSEDVPEIHGNSTGVMIEPTLVPGLHTPTDAQIISDGDAVADENKSIFIDAADPSHFYYDEELGANVIAWTVNDDNTVNYLTKEEANSTEKMNEEELVSSADAEKSIPSQCD